MHPLKALRTSLRVCLRVLRRGMNKGVFAGIILIVGVGILVASFAAYSEISVVRVEAKSIISAPTSVLWQIMMEVDKYPQWYSVMLEAGGTPRLGAKLRFRVKAMDGSTRELSFTRTVVEFVPERRLVWTGGMFPILMGRHFFEFVPMEDGNTEVIQGEEFRGLYPLFAGRRKMLALRPAYERFNQELAARAAARIDGTALFY